MFTIIRFGLFLTGLALIATFGIATAIAALLVVTTVRYVTSR